MRRLKWAVPLSLVVVLLYVGFIREEPEVDPQVLIDQEVATKLAGWQSRRDRDCRQRAMAQALLLADSMLLEYAREQKLMLPRPSRPLRPDEPDLRRPSDTLELRPFLGDSL